LKIIGTPDVDERLTAVGQLIDPLGLRNVLDVPRCQFGPPCHNGHNHHSFDLIEILRPYQGPILLTALSLPELLSRKLSPHLFNAEQIRFFAAATGKFPKFSGIYL
jgi:hypothetical protein